MSDINKQQAEQKIRELIHKIIACDEAYYNQNDSVLSDADYDALRQELKQLEQKFPELKPADSPSDKVGASPHKAFAKIKHQQPMLSLDNGFSEGDIADFMRKMLDFLKLPRGQFLPLLAELKIDGLSASIHYHKGALAYALTRGDGEIGEDITNNIKTISSIPHQLFVNASDELPDEFEIRGEIFFEKQGFAQLNQTLANDGKKTFSTARNAASGSLRQLDASITASRPLQFFAYGTGYITPLSNGAEFYNATDTGDMILKRLQNFGLPVNPLYQICHSLDELMAFYETIIEKRASLPYEIDGIVYKLNALAMRERLGVVGRYPRWAIAHKFPAEKKITLLNDITIQVGRTGSLTPVAELEIVTIGGVNIQRASLHNEDEIRRKDIRIGDKVEVQRAGDVIPQITRSIDAEARDKNQRAEFIFPETCPECGTKTVREEGEAAIKCPANLTCPAQQLEALKHFVSRNAFNIDGLGEKQLQLFIDKKFITSPVDIFTLKQYREDILALEGFQEKSVNSLLASIERVKTISLNKFIYALGIRHIGTITAKDLAFAYGTLEKIRHSWQNLNNPEQQQFLLDIEGCRTKVLEAIQDFTAKQYQQFDRLSDLLTVEDSKRLETGIFAGKKLLFTGTLQTLSRNEAKAIAEKSGASIVSAVSAKLDYLIVGANPGSKLTKAQALDISILTEEEFIKLTQSS